VAGIQVIGNGTVSALGIPTALPSGNPDTILSALGVTAKTPGYATIREAANGGSLVYAEPSCGRGVGSSPNLGVALGGAALGSVPVIGGALKTVFSIFTGHHAAAVKNEQATLCQAVPDADNFLRAIDQMVISGQLSPTDAAAALDQGFQQWRANEISAIVKDSGGKCNAACVYELAFRAGIEKRKLDYAMIAAQSARGASGVIGGVVNLLTGTAQAVSSAISGGPGPLGGAAGGPIAAGLVPASDSTFGFLLIGGLLVSILILSGGRKK
jgi:hypothetical protein